jgi:hypothetical protein
MLSRGVTLIDWKLRRKEKESRRLEIIRKKRQQLDRYSMVFSSLDRPRIQEYIKFVAAKGTISILCFFGRDLYVF